MVIHSTKNEFYVMVGCTYMTIKLAVRDYSV